MSDDLRLLLENIRQEAARLQTDGLNADDAWLQAIVTVIQRTAEGQALDPFEIRILSELQKASRDTGGKPVPTTAIAVRVGVASRFTMYSYLRDLERRGLVHRPFGRKSKAGWSVAA